MSTVRIIEVLAESGKSLDGAIQSAISEANHSLHGIQSVWKDSLDSEETKGRIKSWSLNCKISFEIEGDD